MTTKRINLLAGTILGGILVLGTGGIVLAQGPTPTPSPSSASGPFGGMMGGQGFGGMMGGQGFGGMMGGGQGFGGMMGGQGTMDADDMDAMHAAMTRDGSCNTANMQSLHDRYHTDR